MQNSTYLQHKPTQLSLPPRKSEGGLKKYSIYLQKHQTIEKKASNLKKKMEFLTDQLREVVSGLSEGQQEEIDVIESIINISETNKESTKEKVFRFLEKRKHEIHTKLIIECIGHATRIRPKERRSLNFLLTSVLGSFNGDIKGAENHDIL